MNIFTWLAELAAKLITKLYSTEALNAPETSVESTPSPTPYSTETASTGQNTASTAKPDHLTVFCTAIKTMEGANPANNNPGNCRCSDVGYLPKYGNVTCNPHKFAVFPTYALGWDYLLNLVHHRIALHTNWTFVDFFNVYAPSGDQNDPIHYAKVVAKACGRPVDSKISDYFRV